jgi:phage-related protein
MLPSLPVRFFRSKVGTEPVRDWLRGLPPDDRRAIGEEIRTVQFGWPVGMPVVRKLGPDLWEVRVRLRTGAARVIFTIEGAEAVLLHGFIKKSQRTPRADLELALRRLAQLRAGRHDPEIH